MAVEYLGISNLWRSSAVSSLGAESSDVFFTLISSSSSYTLQNGALVYLHLAEVDAGLVAEPRALCRMLPLMRGRSSSSSSSSSSFAQVYGMARIING